MDAVHLVGSGWFGDNPRDTGRDTGSSPDETVRALGMSGVIVPGMSGIDDCTAALHTVIPLHLSDTRSGTLNH